MGHTPGPWEHGSISESGSYHGNPSTVYAPGGDSAVATVYGIWTNTDFATADKDPKCAVGMANARLICAAPDLLAALKELMGMDERNALQYANEGRNKLHYMNACAAARAAIAKAEGKQ